MGTGLWVGAMSGVCVCVCVRSLGGRVTGQPHVVWSEGAACLSCVCWCNRQGGVQPDLWHSLSGAGGWVWCVHVRATRGGLGQPRVVCCRQGCIQWVSQVGGGCRHSTVGRGPSSLSPTTGAAAHGIP